MSDSTEDPEKTPSTTEAEQREEGEVVAKGLIRTAAISIFSVLLLVVGLLQATGYVDLFPFGEGIIQWLVFVLLGLILVSIGLWSWRSEPS
ncbi:hypothetical protein U4E84_14945 [Halorubrum sp. AD140]|uniref:hypothetical protein n=1 Tax=Halorubrum sp. AD140 TaxID=3050073 RepID=UPI002ACCE5DF|nr:hypothetical protein [Halorubrum sp. AD140]MDZ5812643.1 hypothetical protein [Halorubrum sp. AD140]